MTIAIPNASPLAAPILQSRSPAREISGNYGRPTTDQAFLNISYDFA